MLVVRWRGSSLPRKSSGWKEREPGERASKVGIYTVLDVGRTRRSSWFDTKALVVGVPFKLRPQARGCTPREQGFTIRCFVDPGKPPCQGPPRPITLTPAQPSRPETRPTACGPSSTPSNPFAPCSLFPFLFSLLGDVSHPWPSVVGVATLDRFAHRLHQSHPRMQSLPHCRVSTPVVFLRWWCSSACTCACV